MTSFKITFVICENTNSHCLHNILIDTGWDQMVAECFFGVNVIHDQILHTITCSPEGEENV